MKSANHGSLHFAFILGTTKTSLGHFVAIVHLYYASHNVKSDPQSMAKLKYCWKRCKTPTKPTSMFKPSST